MSALLERLLDDVYARPDDLGARAVYADALTAAGDARGEFITLQLGTTRTPREAELLATHGRAWAGALDRSFKPERRVFEHGFFAGGALEENLRPAALDAREWQLVTHLELGLNSPEPWLLERVPRLRALGLLTDRALPTLTQRPWQIRVLGFSFYDSKPDRGECLTSEALPKLERLVLTGTDSGGTFAWFTRLPLWRQLTSARIAAPWQGISPWWNVLDASPLTEFEFGSSNWLVRLRRDDAGRLSKLAVEGLGVPCEVSTLQTMLKASGVRHSSIELLPSPGAPRVTLERLVEALSRD